MMKDKLYKNNHKGNYYRARKALVVVVALISGFTAVSVPAYISFQNHKSAAFALTNEEKVAEVVEKQELQLKKEKFLNFDSNEKQSIIK